MYLLRFHADVDVVVVRFGFGTRDFRVSLVLMFLDRAQTLVGARVWEHIHTIIPQQLNTSGRLPTTARPQPRVAEGLAQGESGLLRLCMDGRRDEEEETGFQPVWIRGVKMAGRRAVDST